VPPSRNTPFSRPSAGAGHGSRFALDIGMSHSSVPRWCVAVVDDHVPSRQALAAAIIEAGGRVVVESDSARTAADVIARGRPDVAVIAFGLGDGDGVAAAASVQARAPCPVVLFTSHRDEGIIERAAAAGVMGFLLKPLRPDEVAPVLDLARARFGEIQDLRQRLDARKLIERAKGVLMARQGLSEEAAYRTLLDAAMNQRRPMGEIARAVLVAAAVTPEPAHSGDGHDLTPRR
jgi:response regulator NasT